MGDLYLEDIIDAFLKKLGYEVVDFQAMAPDDYQNIVTPLMLSSAAQKTGIRSFHHYDFEVTKKKLEYLITEK